MKAFISVLLPLPVPLKTRFPGGHSYMDASVLARCPSWKGEIKRPLAASLAARLGDELRRKGWRFAGGGWFPRGRSPLMAGQT